MKTETEIREALRQITEMIEWAMPTVPAPQATFAIQESLVWLCGSPRTEAEIRVKQSQIVAHALANHADGKQEHVDTMVMAADVLAWAMDQTDWPQYGRACKGMALIAQTHKRIAAARN